MLPLNAICKTCGSEEIWRDAIAKWNVETQEWELASVFDHTDCEDCGGECSCEYVEMSDVPSVEEAI